MKNNKTVSEDFDAFSEVLRIRFSQDEETLNRFENEFEMRREVQRGLILPDESDDDNEDDDPDIVEIWSFHTAGSNEIESDIEHIRDVEGVPELNGDDPEIIDGETDLMSAIKSRSVDKIDFLLADPRTDINVLDQNGMTPLIVATMLGDIATVAKLLTLRHG